MATWEEEEYARQMAAQQALEQMSLGQPGYSAPPVVPAMPEPVQTPMVPISAPMVQTAPVESEYGSGFDGGEAAQDAARVALEAQTPPSMQSMPGDAPAAAPEPEAVPDAEIEPGGLVMAGGAGGPGASPPRALVGQPQDEGRVLAQQILSQALSQPRGGGGNDKARRLRLIDQRLQPMSAEAQAAAEALGVASQQFGEARQDVIGTKEATAKSKEEHFGELANMQREANRVQTGLLQARQVQRAEDQKSLGEYGAALDADIKAVAETEVRDRRTTGERVLAAFTIIGGSIAQGFKHLGGNANAKNESVQTVNDAIKRDIQMQNMNKMGRQKANTKRLSLFDRMRQRLMDDDAAFRATMGVEQHKVANMAREAALRQTSDEARLGFEEYAAAMDAEAAASQTAALQAALGKRQTEIDELDERALNIQLKREGGGRRRDPLLEKLGLEAGKQLMKGEEGPKLEEQRFEAERGLPGGLEAIEREDGGYGPRNKRDAEEAGKIRADWAGIDNVAKQIISIATKGGTFAKNDVKEGYRLMGEYAAMASVLKGQGAMTDDEFSRLVNDMLTNPTDISIRENAQAAWKRVQRSLASATNARLETFHTRLKGYSQERAGSNASSGASVADLEATQ